MSNALIVILAVAAVSGPAAQNPPVPTSQPVPPTPVDDAAPEKHVALASGFLFRQIRIDDVMYNFSIYVPPEYDPEKQWPMILFLHGSGERGEDGLLQTEVGMGTAIRRDRSRCPAIVVMPQCRPGKDWSEDMARLALSCAEQTRQAYNIDPDRIYLTGLSLGGYGTWLLGSKLPHYFAAIAPLCGFYDPKQIESLKDLPIWVFHGDKDPAVPVEKSREMVAALREIGANVQYTEYADGTHNVWDRTYGNREFWRWLLAQRRPGEEPDSEEHKP